MTQERKLICWRSKKIIKCTDVDEHGFCTNTNVISTHKNTNIHSPSICPFSTPYSYESDIIMRAIVDAWMQGKSHVSILNLFEIAGHKTFVEADL